MGTAWYVWIRLKRFSSHEHSLFSVCLRAINRTCCHIRVFQFMTIWMPGQGNIKFLVLRTSLICFSPVLMLVWLSLLLLSGMHESPLHWVEWARINFEHIFWQPGITCIVGSAVNSASSSDDCLYVSWPDAVNTSHSHSRVIKKVTF
jgi:hypothetical protein